MTPPCKPWPKIVHPGTPAAMLAATSSQIGYREGQNNDTCYGVEYGVNHVSYCNIGLVISAKHSGCYDIVPHGAYTPATANWFQDHKAWRNPDQWLRNPKAGDWGFKYGFVPEEGVSRIHHVFVVERLLTNGYFLSNEFNTNNNGSSQGTGVFRLKRNVHALGAGGGFGRPNYVAVPKPPVPPHPVPSPYWKPGNPYPGRTAFRVGHAHPAVPFYRAALNKAGFSSPSHGDVYAASDVSATRRFQISVGWHGSDADGFPGPTSWLKVFAAAAKK